MIEFTDAFKMEEIIPPGRYLTTREFAERNHLSILNVRQLVSRNRIKSYLFYGRRLIPEGEKYTPKSV